MDPQQPYTTMTTEEDTPEVGPNDIVIHLVNPFKCGMCELEFLDKAVFKEHVFSHLEQIKREKPSSQIVMNIILPPETPGGVTVTRDILQLGEDGSIKQVIQPANSITLNQVLPLKELEAAGVLKLDQAQQAPATPVTPVQPKISTPPLAFQTPVMAKTESVTPTIDATGLLDMTNSTLIKEEPEDVSDIIKNTDGTFSVAFKGPNNEMQHIQIIPPEGMKGDMMLELTNAQSRRQANKASKVNECDICGKILSSSTNLIRHKMYHSSERPFVCQTCGKGFKDVSNLKKHTMIHNRIFACHLCKKSFLRKSLLAIHLKRHMTRTVFVKCGTGAKEVTLKTFVDTDGTRVEEMSMAALQGQTFEYKKRIMKADPSDMKSDIENEIEDSTASISIDLSENGVEGDAAANNGESATAANKSVSKFTLPEDILEKTAHNVAREDVNSGPVDDLPELELQDVPKDFVKMYQCGHCNKRTVQRGNMMRHLIHHLKDKPFKCDECPKEFVDKGELVKHMKTHTKPYRCDRCDGAFSHNVQLIKHRQSDCLGDAELNYTFLEDGQTYSCDFCQIEMKRLGNMIKHVNTHSGSKLPLRRKVNQLHPSFAPYAYNAITRRFQCNHCSKVFFEKRDVHQHIKVEHGTEKVHQCPDCDKWFKTTAELREHSILHAKPFKCDQCEASFSHKITLESHKKTHEEKDRDEETVDYGKLEDKTFYCKHCDKKLSKKFRMMNHIRRHIDHRPFECSDCNKCFSSQFMLSNHKKSHAKLFTCETCGEAFTRKLFLQIHRKKHDGIVEMSPPPTPKEDKKRKRSMDGSNEESSVFYCRICASPFSRDVIKTNHERKCREESKVMIRLLDGKFQCKICQRVATLKHNLMVHIKNNHSEIVRIDRSGEIRVPEQYLDSEEDILLSLDSLTPQAKKQKRESDEETPGTEGYTEIAGGFACNKCRAKFSDVNKIFEHLKSHRIGPENGGEEEGEKSEADTEDATASEVGKNTTTGSEENETGASLAEKAIDKEPTSKTSDSENSNSKEEEKITSEKSLSDKSKQKASDAATPSTRTPKPKSKKPLMSSLSVKVELTPLSKEMTDSLASSKKTPQSSSRPSRAQKIPSRFLE